MTQATQRAHLTTIIESVSDVGLVYDLEKWAMHWSDVLAALKTTIDGDNVIRAWMITWRALRGEPEGFMWEYNNSAKGTAVGVRGSRWLIRGVLQHNDADESEKTAAALTEAVMNALDLSSVLHDQDLYYNETPPCSCDVFELRLFAGVLCHYIEITQELREIVAQREI